MSTEVERNIAKESDARTNAVLRARDAFGAASRGLHNALTESRVAAIALAAVAPDHDYIASAWKYDAEARELVAEWAPMFSDDGRAIDDEQPDPAPAIRAAAEAVAAVIVAGDGPPLDSQSPTSKYGPWLSAFEDHLRVALRARRGEQL